MREQQLAGHFVFILDVDIELMLLILFLQSCYKIEDKLIQRETPSDRWNNLFFSLTLDLSLLMVNVNWIRQHMMCIMDDEYEFQFVYGSSFSLFLSAAGVVHAVSSSIRVWVAFDCVSICLFHHNGHYIYMIDKLCSSFIFEIYRDISEDSSLGCCSPADRNGYSAYELL